MRSRMTVRQHQFGATSHKGGGAREYPATQQTKQTEILIAMASNLLVTASNLLAMASPNRDGLQQTVRRKSKGCVDVV